MKTATVARYRFTRAAYQRLGTSGILSERDRVELLDGEIVQMSPIGSRHAAVVDWLARQFIRGLRDRAICRIQNSVAISNASEPQPDIVLAQPRADGYFDSIPEPREVILIVEVAESSIDFDLGEKRDLYAGAAIPEYWVIDINQSTCTMHRNPADGVYQDVAVCKRVEEIRPAVFPELSVRLADILP